VKVTAHHFRCETRALQISRKAIKKALNKKFRKALRLDLDADVKVHKTLDWELL
jgi:hypothetical protein